MDPFRCFFDIVSSLALLVVSSFADTGTEQPTHRFGPISGVNPQKRYRVSNRLMSEHDQVIVIGSGSGGKDAAILAARTLRNHYFDRRTTRPAPHQD